MDYAIDKTRGIIFTRAWGTLTDDELLGYQQRLRADAMHNPAYWEFVDFSQVVDVQVSSDAVEALANNALWEPGAKLAILAPTDLKFGMTRIYQTLSPDRSQEIQIFRDKLEALAWLGLEGSDVLN